MNIELIVNNEPCWLHDVRFNAEALNDYLTYDGDNYHISETDFNWWSEYNNKYNNADDKLKELFEKNEELKEEFFHFIIEKDFNDYPEQILYFIELNK